METSDGRVQPYVVEVVDVDGKTMSFAQHGHSALNRLTDPLCCLTDQVKRHLTWMNPVHRNQLERLDSWPWYKPETYRQAHNKDPLTLIMFRKVVHAVTYRLPEPVYGSYSNSYFSPNRSTAMKFLSSLLTASLMIASGAVLAHEPKPPLAPPQAMDHSKMDMSQMTPADHEKMAMAQFDKFDTNKDSMLSKAEFAKLHEMMSMQHESMDNGKMDHSKMGMQHDKMDHSKMDMAGIKHADHQKMAAEEFTKLDKNKDGKLNRAEIPAQHPLYAHFDMLDDNKDGSVSKDEFTKHHGM
jgi:hypothetical protein